MVGVEIDGERNRIAVNNAAVYEVEEFIQFITGDVLEVDLEDTHSYDLVFLSPPWGGTEYANQDYYSIFTQISRDGVLGLL